MPSVQVSPETFEELQKLAAARGSTPGEVIEKLLRFGPADRLSRKEWRERAEALLDRVQSRVPPELSEAEIEAGIDEAVKEMRAERRANSR